MSAITTHVLDTVLGKPGAGIRVSLEKSLDRDWVPVGESVTDPDGRCRDLPAILPGGTYRLVFATGEYLAARGRSTIFPSIAIIFQCGGDPHYHLPLLLSDSSYTTYRGS